MALPEQTQSTPRASGKAGALALGLVIGLAAGFGSGYFLSRQQSFESGYEAARTEFTENLRETGLFLPVDEAALETRTLSGEITEIRDGSFFLKVARPGELNPIADFEFPTMREVRISGATKFVRLIEKTPEQIDAEVNAPDADPAIPPEPFFTESTEFSSFEIGDTVLVAADENIFSEASFEAIELSLQVPVIP